MEAAQSSRVDPHHLLEEDVVPAFSSSAVDSKPLDCQPELWILAPQGSQDQY